MAVPDGQPSVSSRCSDSTHRVCVSRLSMPTQSHPATGNPAAGFFLPRVRIFQRAKKRMHLGACVQGSVKRISRRRADVVQGDEP
jgi:hypothetical protein